MQRALALAAIGWLGLGCGSTDSNFGQLGGAGGEGGGGGVTETGGVGGQAGAGASAGAADGGAGGAGGAAGGATCVPPTDPTKAALCLDFDPELVELGTTQNDDGVGRLLIQIFDTNNPVFGVTEPLVQVTRSGQLVTSLASERFDGLPSRVFVRTALVDRADAAVYIEYGGKAPGTWLGGYDFRDGDSDTLRLEGIELTPGAGTSVTQALTVLRSLTVTVSTSATPAHDGIGPAVFFPLQSNVVLFGITPSYGIGWNECADVSDGTTTDIEGYVIGPGDFYLLTVLDDLMTPEEDFDGFMLSAPALASPLILGDGQKVTFGPTQYSASTELDLNLVAPVDSGKTPQTSCTPSQ
jgi:hypothetical protein